MRRHAQRRTDKYGARQTFQRRPTSHFLLLHAMAVRQYAYYRFVLRKHKFKDNQDLADYAKRIESLGKVLLSKRAWSTAGFSNT